VVGNRERWKLEGRSEVEAASSCRCSDSSGILDNSKTNDYTIAYHDNLEERAVCLFVGLRYPVCRSLGCLSHVNLWRIWRDKCHASCVDCALSVPERRLRLVVAKWKEENKRERESGGGTASRAQRVRSAKSSCEFRCFDYIAPMAVDVLECPGYVRGCGWNEKDRGGWWRKWWLELKVFRRRFPTE
jgi:hypothetical protein